MSKIIFYRSKVKPRRCYVYAIKIDGVVRYIGKGTNGRVHEHFALLRAMARDTADIKRCTNFHKRLHKAWKSGAEITYKVLIDDLSSNQAYRRERSRIGFYNARWPHQLWNLTKGGSGFPTELWADPKWRA